MTPAALPAVRLHGVGVQRGTHWALRGVDLTLPRGCLTALVGPNGAGKSTLLELLAGLRAPTEGRLEWPDGLDAQLAWLPQHGTLDTSLPVSALETVMLGHWPRLGAFGRVRPEHRRQALATMQRVGLAGLEARRVGELSSGQLQRLLIARLMLQDQPLVLMDEPFAAVDEATARDLLALMRGWAAQGRTVVLSTHDLAQVRAQVPHAVLLAGGVLASGPTAEVLQPEALARARERAWADA